MIVSYSKNDRYIAFAEIIGAVLVIGFWIGWFTGILKSFQPGDPFYDVYYAFESSFPLADAWIVVLLLISAYGILQEKFYGRFIAISAGGALVFLGLIDVSFNLQQGIYMEIFVDLAVIVEILVNLACLIGGLFLIIWFTKMSNKN
ncbi:MAG: hypothetical protein ACFFC7_24650 [Candidatus Hermodarchaeota archaeon]